MVLWEITAITAYFLGLKRTYRLALKIQRRVVGRRNPKVRDFLHRRTRDVFNVAVSVHKNIQERDIEVGRNVGNLVLRWLDRMKPSAQIRPHPPKELTSGMDDKVRRFQGTSQAAASVQKTSSKAQESSGKVLFTPLNVKPKNNISVFPMMMQPTKSAGSSGSQFRRLSHMPSSYDVSAALKSRYSTGCVFRSDIAQLMHK